MKNLAFILFLLLSSFLKAQVYNSSCLAHDSVIKKYRDDADRLNVRRIFHVNSNYKDSITLNKTISNNYLKALLAVYNATQIPARDTVIDMLQIHTYNPPLNNMTLMADSSLQWMKNVETNVFPTGNPKLDHYMVKYSMHKVAYARDILYHNATAGFKIDTNCNVIALGDTILSLPGVIAGGADYLYGSGNDIVDSITPNYTWLVYSIGWGDCYNQCMYHHYWKFKVYNDCSVEYGGSYGVPITLYAGILQNTISPETIKVYPNPARDKLMIENLESETHLALTNILGKTIYSADWETTNASLSLAAYLPGIYYLKIKSSIGSKTVKIIKE